MILIYTCVVLVADLNAGASAWIHWNLILNEKGGPHLTSPKHNNDWV